MLMVTVFFFPSRRRHTRSYGDWSSDVCSSDLRPMLSEKVLETELNQNRTPEPSTSRSSSPSLRPLPPKSRRTSRQQTSLPPKSPQPKSSPRQKSPQPKPKPKPRRPGRKLLAFDRRLGARFIAGTDEAGRGSLAGPLGGAGGLLDDGSLRD